MTQSARMNVSYILHNNVPVGICLGFDFLATHECGIGQLTDRLGSSAVPSIFKDVIGAATITLGDSYDVKDRTLFTKSSHGGSIFAFSGEVQIARATNEPELPAAERQLCWDREAEPAFNHDKSLKTAWGNGDFVIHEGTEGRGFLERLHEAFCHNDLVMFDVPDRRGDNGGLNLIIKSAVPYDFILERMGQTV